MTTVKTNADLSVLSLTDPARTVIQQFLDTSPSDAPDTLDDVASLAS